MIEVLKQALEALEDFGVLTDREWQAVHKNKANELRKAIAELESQEPVAYINVEKRILEWAKLTNWETPTVVNLPKIPLYTHPPQRTWVGLTDDEIKTICSENGWDSSWQSMRFAKAIEAKLKQKNGFAEEKNNG